MQAMDNDDLREIIRVGLRCPRWSLAFAAAREAQALLRLRNRLELERFGLEECDLETEPTDPTEPTVSPDITNTLFQFEVGETVYRSNKDQTRLPGKIVELVDGGFMVLWDGQSTPLFETRRSVSFIPF